MNFKSLTPEQLDKFVQSCVSLTALGMGQKKVATAVSAELGISANYRDVREALASAKGQELLAQFSEESFKKAKELAKAGAGSLVPKALEVIKNNLNSNNLKAAGFVMQIVGALDKNPDTAGAQNVTVIIPGARDEKEAVEVQTKDNFIDAAEAAETDG